MKKIYTFSILRFYETQLKYSNKVEIILLFPSLMFDDLTNALEPESLKR